MNLNIVFLGLSITSSWGNGHATTYRALVKALAARGHQVTFLERDVPWYRKHRDLTEASYCKIHLYRSLRELAERHAPLIRTADLVVLGSYVPDGIALGDWITTQARGITAFYDIDTPVTLAGLDSGEVSYISARLIPRFDLYLSFCGGPALGLIEERYAGRRARPLYCSAEPSVHAPEPQPRWTLGYLGTYSEDRQQGLDTLLFAPAEALQQQAFVIAGAKYPDAADWPENIEHIEHLPPDAHAAFYRSQRFTLNVTRKDMKHTGYAPSVRLFEAAACGVPIISDRWPGIETIFAPGSEILCAADAREMVKILTTLPEERRRAIAAAAHARLVRDHTPAHRARQIEAYYLEASSEPTRPRDAMAHLAHVERTQA